MVMVAEEPAQLDEPVVAVWAPGSAVLALGEGSFDQLAARSGRKYGLFEYHGAPDAERKPAYS